jgi:hypothetical protein
VSAIATNSFIPDDEFEEEDEDDLDFAEVGQSRQWVPYGLGYDAGGDGDFFLGRVRGRHLFEGGSYVVGRGGLSMA